MPSCTPVSPYLGCSLRNRREYTLRPNRWRHRLGKVFPMLQKPAYPMLAILLLGAACIPVSAAEREDVRKVINLVTSVKMPYLETLTRNRARTERVWLERGGTTTGCIRLEDRRWGYEYVCRRATGQKCSASAMSLREAYISVPCTTTWLTLISTV